MKKITALILAMLIVISCAAPALAFTDVNDADTATAAEVLRLMGVIDGYPDGSFKPNNSLKRSEFCKMAIFAKGVSDKASGYQMVTIFPDVKPSQWFAPYVNMAAKSEGMISGYPDGSFKPENTIKVGEAVAILMRAVGYTDSSKFPIWPDSYLTEAKSIGMLDGTGLSVSDGKRDITRAEAAKLFVAMLKLGKLSAYNLGKDDATLSSVDASAATVTLSGGTTLDMAKSFNNTTLIGSKGKVLTDSDGKFVTILPEGSTGSGITNAAVIVAQNGSTAGFSTLSDGNSYKIYKNGKEIGSSDIKKYDVATYSSNSRSIVLCDTRISVYYEGCDPNPDSPSTVTVLNGTQLTVLESARNDIAKYKPGDVMTIMLTANGQVAGVTDASAKNMAIVGSDGKVKLFLGNALMDTNAVSLDHAGELVSVSSYKKDAVSLNEYTNSTADFDPVRRIMGDEKLSSSARIFYNGSEIASSDLGKSIVNGDDIHYARRDADGNIDLMIIPATKITKIIYGKARYDSESRALTITNGDGSVTHNTTYLVNSQDYVAAKEVTTKLRHFDYDEETVLFTEVESLAQMKNVKKSAFSGKSMITFGGASYVIPVDVQCYNKDSQSWVTLDQALAYSDTFTCYSSGGNTVRIIEVSR